MVNLQHGQNTIASRHQCESTGMADTWLSAGADSCVTFTIFASPPSGTPSASNIDCRGYWQAYTVYRELPISGK